MGLHLDAVNKSAKIIVIGLQGGDIEGYLNQDISLSGATDWQMPEGSASQQKFSETVNNIKTVTNRFGGNAAQTQYKNIIGTLMQWQGSQNYTITLPFLFVAMRAGEDVRSQVKILMGSLYPEISGSMDFFSKLKAPNSYTIKGSNAEGVCSIKIGKWFQSPKLFLLTGCDFTFSKETMSDTQYPLWAQGSASFMSYRLLGRSEVEGFFV